MKNKLIFLFILNQFIMSFPHCDGYFNKTFLEINNNNNNGDITLQSQDLLKEIISLMKLKSDDGTRAANTCEEDLTEVVKGLSNGFKDMWAMQMIDSWGKIPSGFFYGRFTELGNFDECLNITHKLINVTEEHLIKGQYCLATVNISQIIPPGEGLDIFNTLSLNLGICLPSSCSPEEIKTLLEESTSGIVSLTNDSCSIKDSEEILPLDWFAIILLSLFGLLLILSTSYDYILPDEKERHPLFVAFSVRSNGAKLFKISYKTSPDTIDCFNGIRCLSIIWVIFGHTYMHAVTRQPLFDNSAYLNQWIKNTFSSLIFNATVSVDTFFMMSGFLVAWIMLKHLDKTKGKINILLMYFHRYIRLTPILAIAILFTVTLFKFFASGPYWPMDKTNLIASCEKWWWTNFLYVQNYVTPKSICLGHTWYLAVDTQLYFLSPLVIIPLWKWGKKFIGVIILLMFASMGYTFATYIVNDFTLSLSENTKEINPFTLTYVPTHTRYSPWLIGVLLAYYLHLNRGCRVKVPKIAVLVGWISSIAIIGAILFAISDSRSPFSSTTVLESAFYESLSRSSWAIALCWITFACTQGYGGPINSFLSLGYWQPLGRLTYSIYIWHMIVQVILKGSIKNNIHFSDLDEINSFWTDFGITLCVAIVTTLTFESPILQLEKLIIPGKSSSKSNETNNQAQNNISQETLESATNSNNTIATLVSEKYVSKNC